MGREELVNLWGPCAGGVPGPGQKETGFMAT